MFLSGCGKRQLNVRSQQACWLGSAGCFFEHLSSRLSDTLNGPLVSYLLSYTSGVYFTMCVRVSNLASNLSLDGHVVCGFLTDPQNSVE